MAGPPSPPWLRPTNVLIFSFVATVVAAVALFVLDALPLWLAAVLIVVDGIGTLLVMRTLERSHRA
jgi:hypothetical protein